MNLRIYVAVLTFVGVGIAVWQIATRFYLTQCQAEHGRFPTEQGFGTVRAYYVETEMCDDAGLSPCYSAHPVVRMDDLANNTIIETCILPLRGSFPNETVALADTRAQYPWGTVLSAWYSPNHDICAWERRDGHCFTATVATVLLAIVGAGGIVLLGFLLGLVLTKPPPQEHSGN